MTGSYMRLIATGFVLLLMQIVLAPLLSIQNITPDLLIIFILIITESKGPITGLIAGFAAGLSLDLMSTGPLGVMALSKCTIGFWSGYWLSLRDGMISSKWWLLLLFLCVTVQGIIVGIFLLGSSSEFTIYLWRILLPTAIYTSLIGALWAMSPWGIGSRMRGDTLPRKRMKLR